MADQELHSEIALPKFEDAPELEKVPDFLKGDNWFGIDISADILDFDEQFRPPRYTMERGGVRFADVGELHLVTGKPGNGKTGLMSWLEAITLSGSYGGLTGVKVKHRIKDEKTGNIVEMEIPTRLLHIDTEQGKDDTIAFKNRVCSMAGLSSSEAKQHFFILRLRDTEKAADRWRKILYAIYMFKPTDIFIDGLLDIVEDYNDQKECQPIIRKCMMTATEYDASLWAVLHENPMVDKLVGTLGSIAQRKVSEIFAVRKVKQCELKPNDQRPDLPQIYFEVKQLKARGKDVDDWKFEYITSAGGWGMPVEINTQLTTDEIEEAKLRAKRIEADDYFKLFNWKPGGANYTDVESFIKSKGVVSNRKIKELFDIAREAGIIYQNENRKYFYGGLNDTVPNDKVEKLPFESEQDEAPF